MFIYEGQKIVIGLINTISEPFCESCDRLRVDSRGWLYPCLHEYEGIDLLTMMRKGEIDLANRKSLPLIWIKESGSGMDLSPDGPYWWIKKMRIEKNET